MLNPTADLPVSTLAFATTLHLAIFVIRRHRTPEGLVRWTLAPSNVFCAAPWLLPSMTGVATTLAAHVCWFAVCETFFRGKDANVRRGGSHPAGSVSKAPSRAPSSAGRSPSPPKGFVPMLVLAVLRETPTIRTFRLKRTEGMVFLAGQFLAVQIMVDGAAQVRCYSISSAPESSGYFDISVKRQGLVSGVLHDTVQPGTTIQAKPPSGKFVYPAGEEGPIVLLAGGVGITPVMSMLRHAVAADPTRSVTLLYAARGDEEFAYADELAVLTARHPHCRVVFVSSVAPKRRDIRTGRIDADLIRECVPDPPASIFLMCGPGPMIDDAETALKTMGVVPDRIRYEVFQQKQAVGASAAAAEAAGVNGDAHQLTLAKSDVQISVKAGQTLLDAAEAAGVDIPSICRSGVCGTCRSRLICGNANCTSDTLDEDERNEGWVLPCVTWATGDCSLDA